MHAYVKIGAIRCFAGRVEVFREMLTFQHPSAIFSFAVEVVKGEF
jgi:hypothetical protein